MKNITKVLAYRAKVSVPSVLRGWSGVRVSSLWSNHNYKTTNERKKERQNEMKTQGSYGAISERLGNRSSRKVGNNTYLLKQANGSIALRLHATHILTFYPSGITVANSGGWKTVTTKARLNEWLPFGWGISQNRGIWSWWHHFDTVGEKALSGFGSRLFTDGDSIAKDGTLHAQASPEEEKKQAKLRRKVLKYAKQCAAAVPLDHPSGGDSWLECLTVSSGPDQGKTLGDATKDTARFYSYMEESYVVPSLVYHALQEAGNTDLIISAAFKQPATQDLGHFVEISRERVRSAVASYIFRRLGLVAKGGWGRKTTGFAVR